jgi:HlyD family secretion protein
MKSLLALLAVLGLVAAAVGAWYVYGAGNHRTAFRTVAAERGNLLATISATGTIEPEEVVDVGAQVAGMIESFGRDPRDSSRVIDYGSPVEKDTVLAQIDKSLYQAQVEQSQAQVEQAQAQVEQAQAQVEQAQANVQRAEADLQQLHAKLYQAERDWNRAKTLGRTKGVISDLDYDTAQATYETSKANVAVGDAAVVQARAGVNDAKAAVAKAKATLNDAKASLKRAEINLGYCTIKSPVKGVIVDRRVNVGQTVVASLNAPSLFLIAQDLTRLQIWASVNEADIGQIKPGQAVGFTVDAYPDEMFRGEVAQIRLNATMTQNVVTYTVVVNADNSAGKLLPYLTANLQFEVSQRSNVLLVPNAALRWRPQPNQVAPEARDAFVKSQRRKDNAPGDKAAAGAAKDRQDRSSTVWVEDSGFVRPVKVRTGLTDGAMTEIVGGDLTEGAVVVGAAHQNNGDGGTSNPFTPKMFGGGNKQQ